MNSWFDCLLDCLIIISIFNKGIAQLLSFTISTVLKTATYLKFPYIKLKNVKQKEEEEKKTDKIFEKVKPRYYSQN